MKVSWALALVALSSCGGRGCKHDEDGHEKLDGPVKVALLSHVTWAGGGRTSLGTSTAFHLHVGTDPPFDEPVECTAVDLAENSGASVLAFRCKNPEGSNWQALRLGKNGRHVRDCSADLGSVAEPDFGKVRPLGEVASAIVLCHERGEGTKGRSPRELYETLARELHDMGGLPALRAFLSQVLDRPISDDDRNEDPWVSVVAAIPEQERKAVESDLCPSLADSKSSDSAYVRAARLCSMTDARAGDEALARVRAGLSATAANERIRKDSPLEWAVVVAMHTRPREVGEQACKFVATALESDFRVPIALTALAASKTACPSVVRALTTACNVGADCDGGICSPSELQPGVDAWLAAESPDGGVRAFGPTPLSSRRALLAATYASGPLPAACKHAIDTRVRP